MINEEVLKEHGWKRERIGNRRTTRAGKTIVVPIADFDFYIRERRLSKIIDKKNDAFSKNASLTVNLKDQKKADISGFLNASGSWQGCEQ